MIRLQAHLQYCDLIERTEPKKDACQNNDLCTGIKYYLSHIFSTRQVPRLKLLGQFEIQSGGVANAKI